ncbi:MAG: hypothetical protein S4CHLAM45_05850 [Chlamydiales bacterium]|nr:hypothetical protein [Chlamydiales bacterium]MCH9619874.1 hypothetical protein [Chlamydiales bacterium]MCH9622699.1 hypothetical protein [Chlamydiales bacterium]
MNPIIVQSNLTLLLDHSLDGLKIGANHRLEVGEIDEGDRAKLYEVIEQTFAFASKEKDEDLWVRAKADPETVTYASPGHVLEVVKRALPNLDIDDHLPSKKKIEQKIELVLGGESFYVDRRPLIQSSKMFEKLFTGGFAEKEQGRVELELSPHLTTCNNAFKIAIARLQGSPFPQQMELTDYVGLALVFDYFGAKDLREDVCREIAVAGLQGKDFLPLASYPTNLLRDVVHQMDKDPFIALYHYLQKIPEEDQKEFDVSCIVEQFGGISQIKGEGWSVSIGELIVPVVNKQKLPLSSFGENIFQLLNFLDLLGGSTQLLEYVDIKGIKFFDNEGFIKILDKCPNMLHLSLSRSVEGSTVTGGVLEHLEKTPKLQFLDISNCDELERDSLKHLQHVPDLQSLNITGCDQFERDSLKHLQHVSDLQYLNTTFCTQLERDALKHLQHVPDLQYLNIKSCSALERDGLKHLQHVCKLQFLSIGDCVQFEQDALKHLRHVPDLQSLNISNCYLLERDALKHLQHVPELRSLDIPYCEKFERDVLRYLQHVRKLRFLNMSLSNNLGEDTLKHLQHVPDLQSLDISYCTKLEPKALKYLKCVRKLQSLNIAYCHTLERDSLKYLEYVRKLQYLNIKSCHQLDSDALKHLEHVPDLQSLIIDSCASFSDGLKHLQHVPDLQSLSAIGCHQLDSDGLKHLEHTPKLRDLKTCEQLDKSMIPEELAIVKKP